MQKKIAVFCIMLIVCSLCACSSKDKPTNGTQKETVDDNTVTMEHILSEIISSEINETNTTSGVNDTDGESDTLDNKDTQEHASETESSTLELETYLDINTIPIEKSVEIRGNSVVQISPISGWGYQTTEFKYNGEALQSVQVTAFAMLAITDEDYEIYKQTYETMGYTDVKKEEVYKITAVCNDISKSDFWSYANYNKENLKKKLLGEKIEEEIPTVAHSVAWEDIKYIPEGMPKLADSVSDDFSNPIANGFSVVWNELPQKDMEAMRKKLEKWSGSVFSKPSDSDLIVYLVNTDKLMMSIYYYTTLTNEEPQCSITVSIYK